MVLRGLATAAAQPARPDTLPAAPPTAQPVPQPRPRLRPAALPVLSVLEDLGELLRNDIGGASAWFERVQEAAADLAQPRRGRIAVIGDALSGPRDVVSALLQDPLADSAEARAALLGRYTGASDDALLISHAPAPARSEGSLACPASWLQASGYDVVEVAARPSATTTTHLLRADAALVVVDPYRLVSPRAMAELLPVLATRPAHFVVNGPLPPSTTEAGLADALRRALAESGFPAAEASAVDVSFVDAAEALGALDALASALASEAHRAPSFAAFQSRFLHSRIGPLQAALGALTRRPDPQLSTAAGTAALALEHVGGVVSADEAATRAAADVVGRLRRQVDAGLDRAAVGSIVSRELASAEVAGGIAHCLGRARGELERRFAGRLAWLALLLRLRVDDVGAEIGAFVDASYGRDIEQQLVYEAGQLLELQQSFSAAADATVRQLAIGRPDPAAPAARPPTTTRQAPPANDRAGHPFTSPLLLNHLRSLSVSIPPPAPTALLAPLDARRAQVRRTLVPALQARAQRAAALTYTLALAGPAGAWIAAVPLDALVGAGAYAAAAGAALAVVGGVAAGQALWARAQRAFWNDWARVGSLLADDIRGQRDAVVRALVVAKPAMAADGLDELVRKRLGRLADMRARLDALAGRLREVRP